MLRNKHTGTNRINTGKLRNKYPASSRYNPVSSRVLLTQFIANHNFPDPVWDSLPKVFPSCDTEGLTNEEKCLYDAIVMAWTATQPKGKLTFYKTAFKGGSLFILSLLILTTLISFLSSPASTLSKVKEISAATVSASLKLTEQQVTNANGIIESTMSGVLGKHQ